MNNTSIQASNFKCKSYIRCEEALCGLQLNICIKYVYLSLLTSVVNYPLSLNLILDFNQFNTQRILQQCINNEIVHELFGTFVLKVLMIWQLDFRCLNIWRRKFLTKTGDSLIHSDLMKLWRILELTLCMRC